MKKYLSIFILAVVALASACDRNNPDNTPQEVVTEGVYILNNGNYASNDAILSIYNPETDVLTPGVFRMANKKMLGDLAQDMLIYGNKMYIAVYNSKVLFVTDHSGKIEKELHITRDGLSLSPRALVAHAGKVYATMYEGYLAQIDTLSFETRLTQVGNNPEGVVVSNEKVFVANSGGMNYPNYDKTVSVVNAKTMSVETNIEVVENPTRLVTNIRGEVFLISMGNYADIPNTLQRIDPRSYQVTTLTDRPVTYMAMGADSRLYYISAQYDASWNAITSVGVYNTLSGTMEADFVADGSIIKNTPTCISVDPVSEEVYIGTSDYVSEGDMYVFTPQGALKTKFGTGGLNPMGAYFLMGVSE